MWRSLVAHLTGGQGVAGSNPVIPTVFSQVRGSLRFGGAAFLVSWVPKWVPKYALDEHGRRYATGGRCPTSGPDGMDGPYCSPGGGASGLITQRSQVQILPPLQVKSQVRGPFSPRGGRASDVLGCVRYAEPPRLPLEATSGFSVGWTAQCLHHRGPHPKGLHLRRQRQPHQAGQHPRRRLRQPSRAGLGSRVSCWSLISMVADRTVRRLQRSWQIPSRSLTRQSAN